MDGSLGSGGRTFRVSDFVDSVGVASGSVRPYTHSPGLITPGCLRDWDRTLRAGESSQLNRKLLRPPSPSVSFRSLGPRRQFRSFND